MGLIQEFVSAFWETLDEFQAGPDKPRKPTKKKKLLGKPPWMKLRLRRLPEKKERVPLKREVTKLRRPPPKIHYVPVRSLPKKERLEIKRERAVIAEVLPKESWEEKIEEDDSKINAAIEEPQERVERIISDPVKKKIRKNRRFYDSTISKKRKHLLFMNPGTEKIMDAQNALIAGQALPAWAQPFQEQLSVVNAEDDEKMAVAAKVGRLLFEGMPMATNEEKRMAVKRQYFDPKGFSTILPITEKLRETWANISKANVTLILRTIETYQRNFARRRPPKIMGRMVLKNPGILAMDMFFPTMKISGWEGKWNCLTCMDCWSRFTHVYALPDKKLATVEVAMTKFLQEFASFGFMPRRILADRGSDLAAAKRVIEKYRKAKDGNAPMVIHSETAQPINIVESMNAEVQRRLQVFRTADLTDDPSVLLEDISYSINHQPRPGRGNLTPIQLLSLNAEERKRVNDMWDEGSEVPEVQGLAKLNVGNAVRILMWNRKQQAQNSVKGFTAKWSKEVYIVLRKTAIQRNRNNYRYFVGTHQSYFRHELLKIPHQVDTNTLDMVVHRQVVTTAPDEDWSDLEYDSDDSRA